MAMPCQRDSRQPAQPHHGTRDALNTGQPKRDHCHSAFPKNPPRHPISTGVSLAWVN